MDRIKQRFVFVLFFLCCLFHFTAMPVFAEDPFVSAESAVLLSADTGEILYEKDADVQLSMASTTKIMTALLAIEYMEENGDPEVDITEEMVLVEGSSMGLQPGDKLTLKGIVSGLMLASGNDAANTIALFLDETTDRFAEAMNRKASEIGLKNTNFVTPSGLDDDMHYSTSHDMALLAAYALKNTTFREIVSAQKLPVEFLNPEKKVWYTNHNKLLSQYEGCIGVKTGFTKKSGRCLVSAAERSGITLVAVTLNAPDDWKDHAAMLDYGFSKMKTMSFDENAFKGEVPVVGGSQEKLSLQGGYGGEVPILEEDAGKITKKIVLPYFVYAPVQAGQTIGKIEYYIEDRKILSVPVKAREEVGYMEKEKGFFERLFG